MSKIKIEDYKGQTIYYNDDTDKFECDIELNDKLKSTKRQSLNDVRNEIKTFIKLNENFRPFKVISSGYGSVLSVVNVESKRYDGKFVISFNDYSKRYKKESEMAKYFEYDYEIEKEYKKIEEEFKEYRNNYKRTITELLSKLKPLDITTL